MLCLSKHFVVMGVSRPADEGTTSQLSQAHGRGGPELSRGGLEVGIEISRHGGDRSSIDSDQIEGRKTRSDQLPVRSRGLKFCPGPSHNRKQETVVLLPGLVVRMTGR